MKKALVLTFICFGAISLLLLPKLYAVEPPSMELMINHLERPDHGKFAVPFSHQLHGAFDCTECHHMGQGQDVQACSMSGCHDAFEMKNIGEYYSFFKAMHVVESNRTSCRSCHMEMFGDGQYTNCYESVCHPQGLFYSEGKWYPEK